MKCRWMNIEQKVRQINVKQEEKVQNLHKNNMIDIMILTEKNNPALKKDNKYGEKRVKNKS